MYDFYVFRATKNIERKCVACVMLNVRRFKDAWGEWWGKKLTQRGRLEPEIVVFAKDKSLSQNLLADMEAAIN